MRYDNNDNKGGQLDEDNDVIFGEVGDIVDISIVRDIKREKRRLDF